MEVKSRKRGRINQFLIVSSGILFLLGSILIYLFILRGVFGRFSAHQLVPTPKSIKKVIWGERPLVAILYSEYTENMLPEGSTWLNDNVNTWRKFLTNAGYRFDIITDGTLEEGKISQYKLLILPGSKSLSDREIIELKKYENAGGSVFATSGTASYSSDGKWRGWDFFSEVFGLKFSEEISRDDVTKIHTLRGGLPITANIPAGFPLRVATWDKPMAVEVMDPRAKQASFWYNYRLQGGLSREEIKKSAGIVFGNYGLGRFVWMGFEINSVIGVQEDYIVFDRLFNNCMSWLTYKPIAFVKDWPASYQGAAVIAPTVSKDADNIKNLLGILKSEDVKATFFVNPKIAVKQKALINSLGNYGEISSLVDIGYLSSINDTVNHLNDFKTQVLKLSDAKRLLESITHKKVDGFEPEYGLYDQNTIKALIKSGYKYVLTDSLTDRSVPKTIIRGDSLLIGMTKTARDDYEVIRDFGLTVPDYQFYTYQEDIDRELFEGGMYIYKMHSDFQCQPNYVEVADKIIKDLKKKHFWITTASDIEKWWAKRHYIEVRVSKRGNTRVALIVSNPGKQHINGLVVQLNLNEAAYNISLSTEIIGTKLARLEFDKQNHIVYVYIDNMEPGESRTYYIDYNIPKV